MRKTVIAAALLAFGLAACASGGSSVSSTGRSAAATPADAQYLYGYFAGQPTARVAGQPVTICLRTLAIALAVLVSAPAAAQAQKPPGERTAVKNQRVERAKKRCKQNHGVDCDTPAGLKEWLLQERSREEAVRDGSRHLLPAQPSRTR